jgi:tetratricopeptide (TPR) repeat protein
VQAGAVTSLLVTVISVVAAIRIDVALREARAKAAETNLQRQRSAQHFGNVMGGMVKLLKVVRERRAGDGPDLVARQEEASRQAIEILLHFREELEGDQTLRMELAYTHECLGSIYAMLGAHGKAMDELDTALSVVEQLTREFPAEPVYLVQLGQIYGTRGHTLIQEHRAEAFEMYARASAAYRRAANVDPHNPRATNWLAWILLVCPDERRRNPTESVAWAKRSIAAAEGEDRARAWNTLGVAYYRLGKLQAAIEAVETSCQLSATGGIDVDFFVLAMAHWQLGDRARARAYYDEGDRWVSRSRTRGEENPPFQVEAAKLLGVAKRTTPISGSHSSPTSPECKAARSSERTQNPK